MCVKKQQVQVQCYKAQHFLQACVCCKHMVEFDLQINDNLLHSAEYSDTAQWQNDIKSGRPRKTNSKNRIQ